LKLWLLDADVIIDLLSLDLFDALVARHEVYVATTVIGEVKSYKKGEDYQIINFRAEYIDTNKVKEKSATIEEIDTEVFSKLPPIWRQTLHVGELESLAILKTEEDFTICSCDAATIRALPFVDASERGISVESLIRTSGLKTVTLDAKHTDGYFKTNLEQGKTRWIQNFGTC